MQKVRCEVALAGDIRARTPKTVTVPEVAVLEAIHGQGAVTAIVAAGESRINHAAEADRLRSIYNRDEEDGDIVGRLFPGLNPPLPTRLKDIGKEEDATAAKLAERDSGVSEAERGELEKLRAEKAEREAAEADAQAKREAEEAKAAGEQAAGADAEAGEANETGPKPKATKKKASKKTAAKAASGADESMLG